MSTLQAVQVRLMGDEATVKAVAERMVRAGLLAVTGSTPNRQGDGIRIYGVSVPSQIDGRIIDADQPTIR